MEINLKLNESPFPPSPLSIQMAMNYISSSNRYEIEELRENLIEELAKYSGVDKEMIEIFPGSSYQLLLSLIYAKINTLQFIAPFPTFHVMYDLAEVYKVDMKDVELEGENYTLPVERLIENSKGSIVYISNPNNPTSNILLEDEGIVRKLSKYAKLLILDEAYYEFSRLTFSQLVYELENIMIVRTLSKAFSIAGARIGYTISNKHVKETINSMRVGYEVPIVSQAMALGALRDLEYMRKNVDSIISTRDFIREKLLERGIWSPKSYTNFLLIDLPFECSTVERELKRSGIEVLCLSDVKKFRAKFSKKMRVTVGSREEMEIFLEKITEITSNRNGRL
ncbi:MAG: aminotransferase class I/II-fold pyridoxal phosphate-dependent enzyme [Fervidicoccaceae archaeon]